ncbi:tRNA (N(6)-L-threonylcarbamoyladenosine(37)-C(2))-methylthiotransferase MtaB [Eshraghiella crossota]|uniref:tRNA (N(6)-L-threonylcarbamoyladenosine(37)-C(2))- methylthiotransferase MtaB n=1 Tax=Eshraghiella crossota TaxID=45851 RepID=UPI00301FA923|nr:tRNA (N(6)-L-threonylcarbamoyladenosine(37)-C(2))-methylthiotransferase MtaB [Butyrivibrio sp.]
MKKCALHSLGCKVNSYETQAMQKMMESAGYEIVPFGEEIADIYIINTCSVTNIADRKSRQMIHKAKKLNPEAVVAAAGCYVESAGDNIDEDVDIVIGNNEKSHLIEILNEYFEHMDKEKSVDIGKVTGFDELNIDSPLEHTRAYVKIQDGCNRFCSYCIIPYVRGRIRSRKPDDVMAEIKRVAASGCKEVVLTGIHLSSYGLDFKDSTVKLIDVIEAVNRIEGIERIRLGSLEPLIVTEEFVRRLAKCKKICPHFHLSLQSGCDETLKRMNRRYNVDEYYKGVELLREYFPDAAVTTDVIVGFPGETEEEFNITKKYLEKVCFYEMHVFKYSRRKGTAADKMPDQIPENIKSERSTELLELNEILSNGYREKYIGKKVKVLLEENHIIENKKYIIGFTDTYVRVALENPEEKLYTNQIVNVRVKKLFEKDMVIGVAEN